MANQNSGSTRPSQADVDADFAACVRDILNEHHLNHPGLHPEEIEPLVEQIVAAYTPRIQYERDVVFRQYHQIRQMQLHEQALAAHMTQLHDGHVKTIVSRDRFGAQTRVLSAQLGRLSALVRSSAEAGTAMIAIGEIQAITSTPPLITPQSQPLLLSIVENRTRWDSGLFDRADGGQAELHPLIGWSVVARGVVMDSIVEPVFRHNGRQFCQSQMQDQGLVLRLLQ